MQAKISLPGSPRPGGLQGPAFQGPRRPLHEWPPVKSAPADFLLLPCNNLNPASRVMCIGSFIRCRHVLVVMGFFAIVNCFALRFKLSVAIVAMVNLTYVREYDAAAQRLWNSSDVGSSRYHSDDLCVTADENTTDVVDDKVRFICIFNRVIQ